MEIHGKRQLTDGRQYDDLDDHSHAPRANSNNEQSGLSAASGPSAQVVW